eukprot:TRINITY_DN10496_c0_g1_i2.p1 TRINITY_DN10496_c0_g1~~TRINITY_DN10496_c0_g1_i2.p1  ORF type:complete len:364 (+),score=71.20 TRINITY_DN10496_c0_g1_i2:65-1156(+)
MCIRDRYMGRVTFLEDDNWSVQEAYQFPSGNYLKSTIKLFDVAGSNLVLSLAGKDENVIRFCLKELEAEWKLDYQSNDELNVEWIHSFDEYQTVNVIVKQGRFLVGAIVRLDPANYSLVSCKTLAKIQTNARKILPNVFIDSAVKGFAIFIDGSPTYFFSKDLEKLFEVTLEGRYFCWDLDQANSTARVLILTKEAAIIEKRVLYANQQVETKQLGKVDFLIDKAFDVTTMRRCLEHPSDIVALTGFTTEETTFSHFAAILTIDNGSFAVRRFEDPELESTFIKGFAIAKTGPNFRYVVLHCKEEQSKLLIFNDEGKKPTLVLVRVGNYDNHSLRFDSRNVLLDLDTRTQVHDMVVSLINNGE